MKKINNFYSLVALLLLSTIELNAWTFTWVGSNSSSWTTSSNWSRTGTNTGSNVFPGSLDDVVINSGSGNQPTLTSNTTILNLNQSAGVFNLDNYKLTITNDASFVGGTLLRGWLDINNIADMRNTSFDANGSSFVINKTGGSNNDLYGSNSFIGPLAVLNSSSSRFRLSVTAPDIYSGFMQYEERSTGALEPAYNGVNIYSSDMGSQGSTNQVSLGMGNGTILINGYTTVYGDQLFFNNLVINTNQNFSTLGNLSANKVKIIKGSTTSYSNIWNMISFQIVGGSFGNGVINFNNIDSMQNATFNDQTYLVKENGGNDNLMYGGNTFNGTVRITNNSNKTLRLANVVGDDFNGDVSFEQMSTGNLQPAYNGLNTFSSSINTFESNYVVIFGGGNGWVIIDGNDNQAITGDGNKSPIISRLRFNFTGSFNIYIPLVITNQIDFIKGIISTSIYYDHFVILSDNATILNEATNISHINGPMRKIGNDAFKFPIGNGRVYAPISISAPSNTTDHFTAQYFSSAYSATNVSSSLNHVSIQEYWILDRTFGFSNVQVKLSFNTYRSGIVNNLSDLRVSRYNGSSWESTGNSSTTGNTSVGTVESNSVVTNFSPFTLGSTSTLNPLPVSLISFHAVKQSKDVLVKWTTSNENNNDYFTVEKSYDGKTWTNIGTLKGAEHSDVLINYQLLDINAKIGIQYYRLKQTDLSGINSYSNTISVNFANELNQHISLFPQPVSGILNINVPSNESENASVSVYNAMGEKLINIENLSGLCFQIDLSELLNGVYYVEMNIDGVVSQSKILKH